MLIATKTDALSGLWYAFEKERALKYLKAPVVEWFVCSVTVREGVGSSPAGTKVVIPVYTLLRPSVTKQGFVRNHWYQLASNDHQMRM